MKNLETPCFILDKNKIEKNYKDLLCSFESLWSNVIIGYSYKTNSLPWLLSFFKEKGVYAEVVSTPEYLLAKHLGYDDSKIIINGPNKGFQSMKNILDAGGIVNLDSFHEIDWIAENLQKNKEWKVGLRVNFNLELECPNETLMGSALGRFGFNVENGDLERALKRLKSMENVKVVGLHFHNSTKTKSLNIFKALAVKAVELKKEFNYELDFIDIGGGFFGDKPNAPTYSEYAKTITDELRKAYNPQHTALILEPGSSLAASCFNYLVEVIDVRERTGKLIVTTNGSAMNIDPQMNGRKFSYSLLDNAKNKIKKTQVIVGFTCMEKDRYAVFENECELAKGDRILFYNAGAYTLTFTPLFIEYLPFVYLNNNEDYSVLREKWSVEEYVQKNIIR